MTGRSQKNVHAQLRSAAWLTSRKVVVAVVSTVEPFPAGAVSVVAGAEASGVRDVEETNPHSATALRVQSGHV